MDFHATTRLHDGRRIRSSSKTRIYVHPKNETILENLKNRRQRPVDVWREYARKAAAVFDVKFEKLAWSQKAGCSCGCSPGFVVKDGSRPGFDIHVTVG